ncbi:MAG: hypothetical protein IKX13_02555 [Bacteroidales bacterium]|nr:hypothetical protein [Bacteroidales bacterium]
MKNKKLKEYLAPTVEVYAITLEKGFAVSEEDTNLKGTSDKESGSPDGQFQRGENWSFNSWNSTSNNWGGGGSQ